MTSGTPVEDRHLTMLAILNVSLIIVVDTDADKPILDDLVSKRLAECGRDIRRNLTAYRITALGELALATSEGQS